MKAEEVRSVLGEPVLLQYYRPEVYYWNYSWDEEGGPLDCGHYKRMLVLSNEVVVRKDNYFVWK